MPASWNEFAYKTAVLCCGGKRSKKIFRFTLWWFPNEIINFRVRVSHQSQSRHWKHQTEHVSWSEPLEIALIRCLCLLPVVIVFLHLKFTYFSQPQLIDLSEHKLTAFCYCFLSVFCLQSEFFDTNIFFSGRNKSKANLTLEALSQKKLFSRLPPLSFLSITNSWW